MVNTANGSIIRLDSFEDAESLIENYRREIEVKRLLEILETMLSEEDESIVHLSNAAYNDYSLIATEMLPLIDSLLPSIKQFQENIDLSIENVTGIIEEYSNKINEKMDVNKILLVRKAELLLLKRCSSDIEKYRAIISDTKNRFKTDKVEQSFLSIRTIHYCILKMVNMRSNVEKNFYLISNACKDSGTELEKGKHFKECLNLCDEFIFELKKMIDFASEKFLYGYLNQNIQIKDVKYNYNLVLNCIFLLNLKEEFILKIKKYVNLELINDYDFKKHENEKLAFSNTIQDFQKIFESKLTSFTDKIVFSIFNSEEDEYLKFIIDVYIRSTLIYLLEIAESEFSDQIISPTAPMDLYSHQLNTLISFIEKNEVILTNFKAENISENQLRSKKLKVIIFLRQNYTLNNYSKKWKFGTYWNLIYRNILNRRISIRNETVEFSKVYVYETKKYWLKYTIEIIRQIRWILGTSSINVNIPLPPSRCMVPLFTRCLYITLSLLYDYSNYILNFLELCNNEEFSEKTDKSIHFCSKKIKPEYLCCVILDIFSFQEWVKNNFLNELFFHMDQINNEFTFLDNFDIYKDQIIDVNQLKLTIRNELIESGYINHIKNNILSSFKNSVVKYLKIQIVNLFDSGLRAIPCLYRLTNASINKSTETTETDKVPSNYIENASKPIEMFLIFSSNVIKSIKNDLNEGTTNELVDFYMEIFISTLECVFEDVFVICEKQIISAKHQLASLQKLTRKNTETLVANKIDPNSIINQYYVDIDAWISRTLKLGSNFFSTLDKFLITSEYLNEILKTKPNYLKLKTLLTI